MQDKTGAGSMMNKTVLKITLMTLVTVLLYSYLYAADSDDSSVLKPIKVENPPEMEYWRMMHGGPIPFQKMISSRIGHLTATPFLLKQP
jgi:hypothetical protein